MKLETIQLSKLNPAEYNPRQITKEEFEGLKESLKTFGQQENLIVNKDMTIISGHQRYEAMKALGWTEAVCNMVDLDKHQEKKLNVLMNSQAISGKYDDLKLAEILEELKLDYDYESLRLDKLEPLDLSKIEIEEDEAPEVSDEPPVSKLGEVYQLGRHKVFCGDSTLRTSYEKLMGGKNADLVFTDPPYGMKKENEGVLNDNLNYDDLLEFNKQWIPLSFDFMKENGSWYCWGIDEPLMDIYSQIIKPMARKQQATFRNLITWDKGNGQGQRAEEFRSYAVADEKCLFVMGGVQGFNTNQDNYFEAWEPIRLYLDGEKKKMGWTDKWIAEQMVIDPRLHWFGKSQWDLPTKEKYEKLQELAQGGAFKREYDEIKREYDEIKREYYATRAYFDNTHDNMNNVWHFDRTSQEEREGTGEHATPKPLALCSRAINSSTRSGETVLDLFLGSGSTLIACEQTDRTCYGMELDEKYLDVIRKRWAKYVYPDRWEKEWEILTPAIAK